MITIELTTEEYVILSRIIKRAEQTMQHRSESPKWVKKDGCMINTITGTRIDLLTNKPV